MKDVEGGMVMTENRKKTSKRPPELVEAITREMRRRTPTDPQGSWTGNAWDDHEQPVQDADDL